MIKCGHRGLYIRTADQDRLEKMGAAKCADPENWANRELWFPVYQEEKFVGALVMAMPPLPDFSSPLSGIIQLNPA